MKFLVDTNILLYAVDERNAEHSAAKRFIEEQLAGPDMWCLSWPVIYEFLRVATHPRVFAEPLKPVQAFEFIATLLSSESVVVLVPTERHAEFLARTLKDLSNPAGNLYHDIATAVLLREHGLSQIVTADTDFYQFPFLDVFNPLKM